jgi:hypothetical protein
MCEVLGRNLGGSSWSAGFATDHQHRLLITAFFKYELLTGQRERGEASLVSHTRARHHARHHARRLLTTPTLRPQVRRSRGPTAWRAQRSSRPRLAGTWTQVRRAPADATLLALPDVTDTTGVTDVTGVTGVTGVTDIPHNLPYWYTRRSSGSRGQKSTTSIACAGATASSSLSTASRCAATRAHPAIALSTSCPVTGGCTPAARRHRSLVLYIASRASR